MLNDDRIVAAFERARRTPPDTLMTHVRFRVVRPEARHEEPAHELFRRLFGRR